jgi:outer membrane protein assembly factor BamB
MPLPVHASLPLAIVPTFVLVGPLALLAALFPAVFGALGLVLRRWLAVLWVASLGSLFYVVFFWFHGRLQAAGWGDVAYLWAALALLASAGLIGDRLWRRPAADPASTPSRSGAEQVLLWTIALGALALGCYRLMGGGAPIGGGKDWLIVAAATAAGALTATSLGTRAQGGARVWAAPQAITLAVLALGYASLWATATLRVERHPSLPNVQVVWTFEPVERGAIVASPCVADDGVVYAAAIRDSGSGSSGAVYCLDQSNGAVRWGFDAGGQMQPMYSSPCAADGRLYIGEGMHANRMCHLYCLNQHGHLLWEFPTPGHIESSPCVARGGVYFGAGDDGIYGLDARTGARRWHFDAPFHVDASPLVAAGRLYAGSIRSRRHQATELFCLDADSGAPVWRRPTDLPVTGSPALQDNYLVAGLGNGRLTEAARPPETPAGAVVCADARHGHLLWRHDLPDAVFARPALDDRRVYVGDRDGSVYCLDLNDGRELWRQDLGSPVLTTPLRTGGGLYVVASGGLVCRLEPKSGNRVWTFDVAGHTGATPRLLSSPRAEVADGHVTIYFGAELQNPVSSAAMLFCLRD